jgi:fucose permease
VKADLGLGEGELGTALLGMAAGTLVGARFGAWPVERLGSRVTTWACTPALCSALVGPALAGDLAGLIVALVVFGVLSGLLDVAANANAVAVERAYGRPLLSGLHGMWSLGGLAGAAAGGLAAAIGATPLLHFGIAALVLGAAGLVLLRRLGEGAEPDPGRRASPTGGRGRVLWSATVLLLGLIGFSAYFAEGTAADWSAVYLRESLGTSSGLAAAGFAALSLAMAAGRLVADRLVARLGPVRVVRAGALVGAGGLTLGLLVQEPAAGIAAFALLGLGLAPVVPVAFSAAGNTGLGPSGPILARVVTLGYVGSIAGPVVIGWTAEQIGLRAALWLPVGLSVLIALLAGRVGPAAGSPRRRRSRRSAGLP